MRMILIKFLNKIRLAITLKIKKKKNYELWRKSWSWALIALYKIKWISLFYNCMYLCGSFLKMKKIYFHPRPNIQCLLLACVKDSFSIWDLSFFVLSIYERYFLALFINHIMFGKKKNNKYYIQNWRCE